MLWLIGAFVNIFILFGRKKCEKKVYIYICLFIYVFIFYVLIKYTWTSYPRKINFRDVLIPQQQSISHLILTIDITIVIDSASGGQQEE